MYYVYRFTPFQLNNDRKMTYERKNKMHRRKDQHNKGTVMTLSDIFHQFSDKCNLYTTPSFIHSSIFFALMNCSISDLFSSSKYNGNK